MNLASTPTSSAALAAPQALPTYTSPRDSLLLETDVASSITSFDAAEWNALIPCDEPQLRHDFLAATERSGFARRPRYVAVRQGARLVGVAVTVETDIDLLTLASPDLKHVARRFRKGPLKRFLVLKAVVCGPMVTNCRPNVFLATDLDRDQQHAVSHRLIEAVDGLDGGSLRVFFEFPEQNARELEPAFHACSYTRALSLPGTQLPVRWARFDEYTAAMRKFYRRAVRHDQAAANDLDIQIETDFAYLAPEIHRLYSNVLAKAKSNFEELTVEFIREWATCESTRAVVAREKSTGKVVGVELLMVGDTVIQDLYTAIDYSSNNEHHTYFNLVYPGIALACEGGYQKVSTGQTSYAFKSRLGVEAFDLFIFLKHRNPLLNALIRRFHPVICPATPTFTHQVFHEENKS